MSADLHTLTGAYAAHALSDTERLAFERHLDACPACAQEVRELTETAARLGGAVAAPPPPDLWDRVRAEAAGGGTAMTEPSRAVASVSSRTSWSQAGQASRCRSKASRSVSESASAA